MTDNASHKARSGSLLKQLLAKFIAMESAGGIIMIVFALLALLIANSDFYPYYKDFTKLPVTLGLGTLQSAMPLSVFVKDVLMVFFFLVVSMELKKEMMEGFLSTTQQKILPFIAAVGGVVLPAICYWVFAGHPYPDLSAGWAIPTATDIAFALAIVSLFGRNLPQSAKIFLLAIAIYDDLAGIFIIAFVYSQSLSIMGLLASAVLSLLLFAMNKRGIATFMPYMLVGIALWFTIHASGIHTTIAGVIVGLAVPLHGNDAENDHPIDRLITFFHPWISFLILPIFAFVSAGVNFDGLDITDIFAPLPLAIAIALFFGKQIGILGFTWLATKIGVAKLPVSANWGDIYAVSIIAGIGFTMSLFIGFLAFDNNIVLQDEMKIGVLLGSLLSVVWAAIFLTVRDNFSDKLAKH